MTRPRPSLHRSWLAHLCALWLCVPIAGGSGVLTLADFLSRPSEHTCCCVKSEGGSHHCRCRLCWTASNHENERGSDTPQLADNCPDDERDPPLWGMPEGLLPAPVPVLLGVERPLDRSGEPVPLHPQHDPTPPHPPPWRA